MLAADALFTLPLAVVRPADAASLVILLAFTWWGARKGALRQALSLAVLAFAFWAAGRFAPDVVPTVAKLFDLEPDERTAIAWAAVLFGALLAGGILLRLLSGRLPERSRGGADRLLGGLFGATKGAVVLTVVGYAVLAFGTGPARPSLSRPHADPGSQAQARPPQDLSARVQGSLSAVCLEEWGGLLRRWVRVPRWVDRRVEDVNRRLQAPVPEDAGEARPRER